MNTFAFLPAQLYLEARSDSLPPLLRGLSAEAPNSMEQAAPLGDLGLPCSPRQALALYQHLFRCPEGLDQLQAALRQVRATGHHL